MMMYLCVVEVSLEKDDGIRQHVSSVGTRKDAQCWVILKVPRCVFLHHSVDLLCLAREAETREKHAESADEVNASKVELVHIGIHDLLVETDVSERKERLGDIKHYKEEGPNHRQYWYIY